MKNYKITDIGICDEAGYLVSVNVEQQFRLDTAFQAVQVIGDAGQIQNDLEAVHLGVYAGAIESFFPEQDKQIKAIDILALLNGNYNNCLSTLAVIPSSEKVEKFLFQFISDRSLEELEITRPYLIGKLCVQVYMTCELIKFGAKAFEFGGKLFIDGIAKIGAGGTVSLALPFGGEAITIPVAAVGTGEAIAGLATAATGVPIAKMAIQSGENAYKTYKDLKGAGKSELKAKVKKVIDKIPSKFKVNGKCDEFAKKLVNGLKQEGIEYEIIRINSNAGIYSDKAMDVIGDGYHYGIKVGDMVYDNMTLDGMEFDSWLTDLGADGSFADVTWETVDMIINH